MGDIRMQKSARAHFRIFSSSMNEIKVCEKWCCLKVTNHISEDTSYPRPQIS